MQMWELGRGFGQALLKLNRCVAVTLSGSRW
jgi:hypothetical protein